MSGENIYEQDLDRNAANYQPLTPLSFLHRTEKVHPDTTALIHGDLKRSWKEVAERSRQLARALIGRGVKRGDTIACVAANTPEMFEAHFGIPMTGAVINAINTRLDAAIIAFSLEHAAAKVLFTDTAFSAVVKEALNILGDKAPLVIDINDPMNEAGGELLGEMDYEAFIATAADEVIPPEPLDEWQAIALGYTSGTTGNPKGVVTHHRGAFLGAVANPLVWDMQRHPVYLWTLPMFHCNGWTFPWVLAAMAGTSVCLRLVRDDAIFSAIKEHGVTHLCGAPVVMSTIANAPDEMKAGIDRPVQCMTAGAAPPAAVIKAVEDLGFGITHVYGLTETYGPAVTCEPKPHWSDLSPEERSRAKARQGVPYPMLEDLMVGDPETMQPVPQDGETLGEVFFRGNMVMKGYLKNPTASGEAFAGGWFHSGDLATWDEEGYIQIKDRSKDIIISGGENISSLEVENVLFSHPAIIDAAVVAANHEKWGETPCAFVTLREGESLTAEDVIEWCRENLARFKCPTKVIFGPIAKTSTGKVQKYKLRDEANA